MRTCARCHKPMNPVEALLSAKHGVCGECVRREHAHTAEGTRR